MSRRLAPRSLEKERGGRMPQGMSGNDCHPRARARQASLRRALKALLLKGAPSRPGKTSADPAKSIPPVRSRMAAFGAKRYGRGRGRVTKRPSSRISDLLLSI